jgi:hypothetical protein
MRSLLNRHPLPISAYLRRSLVLTYAYPQEALRPLLPPGLALDTYGNFGFLAIAMVQTAKLRPTLLPAMFGHSFFLSGYRIFVRFGSRRGLYILRSDTDSRCMALTGNLMTRYGFEFCHADVTECGGEVRFAITTPHANADLDVVAAIGAGEAPLPPGSPFADPAQSRRFAGPMPFTFDYEPETHSVISVRGVRERWSVKAVSVDVRRNTFLNGEPFCHTAPVLANAFCVSNVPYRWLRGVTTPLEVR